VVYVSYIHFYLCQKSAEGRKIYQTCRGGPLRRASAPGLGAGWLSFDLARCFDCPVDPAPAEQSDQLVASIYSEELSGSEAAEDEWWAQGGGGRGGGCFGGDFGDDAATLARAAQSVAEG
jgi:hypothetical protein